MSGSTAAGRKASHTFIRKGGAKSGASAVLLSHRPLLVKRLVFLRSYSGVLDKHANLSAHNFRSHAEYVQPGSPEASSVCDQITRLATSAEKNDGNSTRFTILTKVC